MNIVITRIKNRHPFCRFRYFRRREQYWLQPVGCAGAIVPNWEGTPEIPALSSSSRAKNLDIFGKRYGLGLPLCGQLKSFVVFWLLSLQLLQPKETALSASASVRRDTSLCCIILIIARFGADYSRKNKNCD